MAQSVQERFGQIVIDGLTGFAQNGIPEVAQFDLTWFDHIQEASVREALCDTLYGARWIYKIGLALHVKDKELFAHVRAQVIDYISICETLLAEMVIHAHEKNKLTGNHWKFKDLYMNSKKTLRWHQFASSRAAVEKQTFAWSLVVCKEEGIISNALSTSLDSMRILRNTVHITERAKNAGTYTLNSSDTAFKVMQKTINETKSWYANNKT